MVDGVTDPEHRGRWVSDQLRARHGRDAGSAVDYGCGFGRSHPGGVTFNYVPREGGNRFAELFFGTGANSSFQGSTARRSSPAQGLTAPDPPEAGVRHGCVAWSTILVDKLWFFSSARWHENSSYVAGIWENLNAGNPTKWLYDPICPAKACSSTKPQSTPASRGR